MPWFVFVDYGVMFTPTELNLDRLKYMRVCIYACIDLCMYACMHACRCMYTASTKYACAHTYTHTHAGSMPGVGILLGA